MFILARCNTTRPRARSGFARARGPIVLLALLGSLVANPAAGVVVRQELDPGVYARMENGYRLTIEFYPGKGTAGKDYLRDPRRWARYETVQAAGEVFSALNGTAQRKVLLALFPDDYIDAAGWHHKVTYAGPEGQETLWSLCEWMTGNGFNVGKVSEVNGLTDAPLELGQWLLIPRDLLSDGLEEATPDRVPPPLEPLPEPEAQAMVAPAQDSDPGETVDEGTLNEEIRLARDMLSYGQDGQGTYAEYRLQPGEALYSSVVVRYTDIREHVEILDASMEIAQRSGVRNVNTMRPGAAVRIPIELLSAPFQPQGTVEREQYEEVVAEARELRGQVQTRNLEGVVVVLDPGHGGVDPGARNDKYGLLEDEINYDIVCRLKRALETQTAAKVYVTQVDRSQGFEPTDARRFVHDEDEELLTNPRYPNTVPATSASLRAAIGNAVLKSELEKGTHPRKILFLSIHCDALFNRNHRGTMVYIPGAQYRLQSEPNWMRAKYGHYSEVANTVYAAPFEDRRRDEALSRNFAETLLAQLGAHRVKRHQTGAPIRNVIRRSATKEYVPAVLHYNMIPTKVLIEAANMTNDTDCERLADPSWRQRFADATLAAIKEFYGE